MEGDLRKGKAEFTWFILVCGVIQNPCEDQWATTADHVVPPEGTDNSHTPSSHAS